MAHLLAVAGWAGAALLLLAYALVSSEKIAPAGAWFHGLNLLGSAGLMANAGYHRAWPSAALNLAWILIGIVTLHSRSEPQGQDPSSPASPGMP